MNWVLSGLSSVYRGVLALPNKGARTTVHATGTNHDQPRTTADGDISMLDGIFNREERQVQAKAGVSDEEIAGYQRYVESTMPKQRKEFFQTRDMMYLTVESVSGRPSAGIIAGDAGFLTAVDDYTLQLDLSAAHTYGIDLQDLQVGRHIGFQALDHGTRRRHRANGRISSTSGHCIHVAVDQSFGACAMYINKRTVKFDASKVKEYPPTAARSDEITSEARSIIDCADTFFLATSGCLDKGGDNNGVDVSHRGGPTGFVDVSEDGLQLKFPEYKGNNFFMSLGNIATTSAADLLFVDYESGAAVTVSGVARIDWTDTTQPGSTRAVVIDVELCSHLPAGSLPIHASPVLEWSPNNPKDSA